MEVVCVEHLTKIYGHGDPQTVGLIDANLSVNNGELVALLGPRLGQDNPADGDSAVSVSLRMAALNWMVCETMLYPCPSRSLRKCWERLRVSSTSFTAGRGETIVVSVSEPQRNGVILRWELADDARLSWVIVVELQLVILNLRRNASGAMIAVDDHPKQLVLRTEWHQFVDAQEGYTT